MRNLWTYYLIRIHASYVELLYPHQQCHHLSTLHGLGASDERKITTTRRGCTAPRWAVAGEFGEKGPNWKVLFGLGKLWKNYGQLLLLWLLVQLMFHWLLMSAHSIWPNHTLKDRKWCLYILHRIQFFFVDWIVFLIFGDYFLVWFYSDAFVQDTHYSSCLQSVLMVQRLYTWKIAMFQPYLYW